MTGTQLKHTGPAKRLVLCSMISQMETHLPTYMTTFPHVMREDSFTSTFNFAVGYKPMTELKPT